jgi:hypothetical protein
MIIRAFLSLAAPSCGKINVFIEAAVLTFAQFIYEFKVSRTCDRFTLSEIMFSIRITEWITAVFADSF